jgi:lipopolysaccharide export system protein LptC
MRAPTARYDMSTEQVRVDGPIAVRAPNNYSLDTTDATIDLKTRQLTSTGAVTGTVRQGRFAGDHMQADLESRTVSLDGNARLRIDRRAAK